MTILEKGFIQGKILVLQKIKSKYNKLLFKNNFNANNCKI